MPDSWVIRDGTLIFSKFFFSSICHDTGVDFATAGLFLREFLDAIAEYGLEKSICFRLFPHVGLTGALECTEGQANINLSPNQVPENSWENSTETKWFFEPEYLKQKPVCRCSKTATSATFKGRLNPLVCVCNN